MKLFIKVLVRIIPVILSFLLLAAHLQRIYMYAWSYIVLLIPFILLYKKQISVRIVQVVLFIGSIEWLRIIFIYRAQRIELGESWYRLAIILGIVAIFTLLSIIVFRNKTLRDIYK